MKKNLILPLFLSLVWGQSTHATMTLYKDGYGLIKQPVAWQVDAGPSTIHYELFPQSIILDSPFLSVTGAAVSMQRMNRRIFNFDRHLRDFLGKKVTVKIIGEKQFKGTLMEVNSNYISLQWKREVVSISRSKIEYIAAPGLVENPNYKATLSWNIISKKAQGIRGNLVYLSRGFDWDAVYRFVLEANKNKAEFIVDALVTNHSNLDFSKLTLQLVEGQLHSPSSGARPGMLKRAVPVPDMAPPQEKQLGDYHIYKISAPLSLHAGENITTRLYEPRNIGFVKTYLFENSERDQKKEPLAIEYELANTKKNGLGIPLPQGKIQVYQKTEGGHVEYVGEDQIRQVPVGGLATLVSGRAFDVEGTRTVLNYDRQRKSEEATISIKIKNTLKKKINVRLIEHIFGDWVIRDASANYLKKDASTIYFPLTIKARGSQTVTYTYRKEWK